MPGNSARRGTTSASAAADAAAIADRLHSAAIHLLRRLRREDGASGLSGPRLSALSVVVARGAIAIGDLADAEQVRAPTMTRLVAALEEEGLVRRVPDASDGRVTLVRATARGQALLAAGRARRVAALSQAVAALPPDERATIVAATAVIEQIAADPG